jgi:hypothetical protein
MGIAVQKKEIENEGGDFEFPPSNCEPPALRIPGHSHVASWAYHNADGSIYGWVLRYADSATGKKTIRPAVWKAGKWQFGGFPKPRPLFNLHLLSQLPERQVFVVEGEKCAAALQEKMPHNPVVCWQSGATSVKHTDWKPLHGRKVIIWPDADEPGFVAAREVEYELLSHSDIKFVVPDVGEAPGFDVADWIAAGGDVVAYIRDHVDRELPKRYESDNEPITTKHVDTEVIKVKQQRAMLSIPLPELSEGKNGPFSNADNAARILHTVFGDRLTFDTFSNRVLFDNCVISGAQVVDLMIMMQRQTPLVRVTKDIVYDAMLNTARQNQVNVVSKWLDALPPWDGTPRVATFLMDVFDCGINPYFNSASKYFWMSLVARIKNPGCKVDMALVLEGVQGIGKSEAVRAIGQDLYVEVVAHDFGSRDFMLAIRGKLICELAELASLRKREIEHVKATITARFDEYRAPYEKTNESVPRTAIFVGTTNTSDWQADDTGGRRFLPVRCNAARVDLITENRTQYFAEALTMYAEAGDNWWRQFNDDEWATATAFQAERRPIDPWEHEISQWLNTTDAVGNSNREKIITTNLILHECLRMPVDRMNKSDQMRIGAILRTLGARKRRNNASEGRGFRYVFDADVIAE